MSSNIQQKKTAPPGSWPCNKGEEATSSGQHQQQHQTQTPRSPPPVPEYQGGYIKSNNGGTTTDSQSGEYTHRDRQASGALQKQKQNVQQKGEQVQEQVDGKVDGETNGEEQTEQREQDSEKPIELKDVDPQPESEAAEVDDVNVQDKAAGAADTSAPGEGEEAELTENAKKAFDQASENQPTDEARNSFLKAARGGLSFVSRSARSVVGGGGGGGEGQSVAVPEEEGQEKGAVDTELEEGQKKVDDAADEEKVDVPEEGEKGEDTIAAATAEDDEPAGEDAEEEGQKAVDFSILKDGTVNKGGNVINASGAVVGRVVEGEIKTLVGKEVDENGAIWSRNGKIIGKAEPIPDDEREEIEREAAPFESFPEAVIDKDGWVVSADGERIGKVEEGDLHALRGKTVDADGDILDKNGNVIGKAKRWEEAPEPEPEPEPEVDNSALAGKRVNKAGNVVDSNGAIWGRVVEGELKKLIGRMCDKNGNVISESGDVLGRAELVPEAEREGQKEGPFAELDECTVGKDGTVVTPAGDIVGRLVSGDGKALFGRAVDEDGDVLDKNGNVIGHAERWAPEPEPEEPEVDKSILAGKRVNKAGNVVDGTGAIFGRVIEGDAKRMVGRMCDKNGNILSESGDILGKADLVSEGEREGLKEGPFAELQGCTVAKDGTVVTPSGDIVGRLTSGDGKVLFGRAVDEDGDVLDRNGNTIGHAERWEPEPVERKKNPMSGRRVNREGNVVDEDGNLIGKLTSGELTVCSGKDIDDDGDVVDYKGNTIGHCSLLEDIPKEEETPEEKEKREQAEQDKKLAVQMTVCVEQCLDSIRPICKMITEKIDKAERTPEEERDEEALVQEVKPLIEEGGRILNEAKGIIKGLDPEGRIAANAKHKTAAREATPEEYRLADVLKDLTGDVTQCIDNAKRKLEDMPHAKKELNPLWGLLNEPLFQILAAVGLLLSGVLNLVGRLLSGLGLGGLVDGLLGTLGLNRVLESLGLGSFSGSLKSGKKKGGGLLGGVLGG